MGCHVLNPSTYSNFEHPPYVEDLKFKIKELEEQVKNNKDK